jgi:hypothetical protein
MTEMSQICTNYLLRQNIFRRYTSYRLHRGRNTARILKLSPTQCKIFHHSDMPYSNELTNPSYHSHLCLIIIQMVKKFPVFYLTFSLYPVFTNARHWYLSWARWIQSIPFHHIPVRYFSTLCSRIHVILTNEIFFVVFISNLRTHF